MIPPHCHSMAVNCKMCRQPITLWIADISDPTWESMLVPMATCNRCFDLWQRRQRAGEQIQRTCVGLHSLNCGGVAFTEKRREMVENRKRSARETLTIACAEYLMAIAESHKLVWRLPANEMVDILMDAPDQYWKVLREARSKMREMAKAPQAA